MRRGWLLAGVFGAGGVAWAVPPPPPLEARVASAALIVEGDVHWVRTSWFWEAGATYRGELHVSRCFKGTLPGADARVDLEVRVHPAGAGGFSGTPREGRFIFFLQPAPGGRFQFTPPEVHGMALLSAEEEARLARLTSLPPPP